MPKIKELKEKEEKITFTLEKATTALANAIRRTAMSEVPIMAITEIDFYENTSILSDEYLAHRLALVPLTTPKTYALPGECCGGNCAKCSTILTLEAEGSATVYSKELKPADKKVEPTENKIPIIKLADKQRIRLEAKATLGRGTEHAKYQPCLATYKFLPIVEISKDCDACAECVDACPKKILKKEGKKVVVTDIETCIECEECVEKCPKNAVKVSHDKNTFLFTIESFGNLKPKEILKQALEVLETKAEEFEKKISD